MNAVDDLVPVQHGCFYVTDPGRVPDEVAEPPGPAELVSVVPGLLMVRSGGATHDAAVRLEAWPGPAPRPDGPWDLDAEGVLDSPSGHVVLVSLFGDRSRDQVRLRLGEPGGYRFRIVSRGRAAAATAGAFARGVESYTVQFWPAVTSP